MLLKPPAPSVEAGPSAWRLPHRPSAPPGLGRLGTQPLLLPPGLQACPPCSWREGHSQWLRRHAWRSCLAPQCSPVAEHRTGPHAQCSLPWSMALGAVSQGQVRPGASQVPVSDCLEPVASVPRWPGEICRSSQHTCGWLQFTLGEGSQGHPARATQPWPPSQGHPARGRVLSGASWATFCGTHTVGALWVLGLSHTQAAHVTVLKAEVTVTRWQVPVHLCGDPRHRRQAREDFG